MWRGCQAVGQPRQSWQEENKKSYMARARKGHPTPRHMPSNVAIDFVFGGLSGQVKNSALG